MKMNIKRGVVLAFTAAVLASPLATAASASAAMPAWLSPGPITQYPSAGGTWQYGFWNAKVKSYYTVNRCHGSTVQLNSEQVRSADTASGQTSIADKYAVNYWGNNDAYYYRTC